MRPYERCSTLQGLPPRARSPWTTIEDREWPLSTVVHYLFRVGPSAQTRKCGLCSKEPSLLWIEWLPGGPNAQERCRYKNDILGANQIAVERHPGMANALLKHWREDDGRIVDLLALGILLNGILIAAAAYMNILVLNQGWKGFFQKPNWLLYPVFWIVLTWLMRRTWHPYMAAWSELRTKGVLHYAADCLDVLHSRKNLIISDSDFAMALSALRNWRRVGLQWAIAAGATLTVIDSLGVWKQFYQGRVDPGICVELDFTIAALPPLRRLGESANIAFDVCLYLMQGVLISLAFCCLLQVCIHLYWFSRIEKLRLKTERPIELTLDPTDGFYEFGLAGWNEAVTKTYLLSALGMLIPLVSFYSQQKGCVDTGQWLMRALVPLLLLSPATGPIWLRFERLAKIRQLIDQCDTSLAAKESKQRIWPFDKYKIGLVLLGVNAVEYCLFIGITASEIVEGIKALLK